MEERIKELEQQVQFLLQYVSERKRQQITFPVDESSKGALGALLGQGAGATALTRIISLTGNAQDITVEKQYAGSELVNIRGTIREFPYIA